MGHLASRRLAVALLAAAACAARATPAGSQTLDQLAARGACSTAGLDGIAAQLVATQLCMRPELFVRAAPHAGVALSSPRVLPLMSAPARDALWSAAAELGLTVNSMFRTVAEQYVLYHSGGCALAAAPGASNHQSGRAVDLENYAAARPAMERAGCAWLGTADPVHFDCPGGDYRPDAIRAFQRLWNANEPGAPLDEDGVYGPMTAARLGGAPAAGFPRDGCPVMVADAGAPDARDAAPETGPDAQDDSARADGPPGDSARPAMDGGEGGLEGGPAGSCACRAAGHPVDARAGAWLALTAGVLVTRRRRTQRAQRA